MHSFYKNDICHLIHTLEHWFPKWSRWTSRGPRETRRGSTLAWQKNGGSQFVSGGARKFIRFR